MSWAAKRYHDISCGHRVYGHESKCAHLHGHNYRITFTCAPQFQPLDPNDGTPVGGLDSIGRVIDFSDIKTRLCMWLEDNWDHKFLVWTQDPDAARLSLIDPRGLVQVPFNPTAENMAEYLVRVVGPAQLEGTGIVLVHCEVEETRKCSATYAL